MNLWVVIPAMTGKLCIPICSTPALCGELESKVNKVVGKAVTAGYKGGVAGSEDFFMSGHSLGGVCASTLTQRAFNKGIKYQSLTLMGSYVGGQDVENFPVPVMTIGAELDGGLGRPGMINISLTSSDNAAIKQGGHFNTNWQMKNKPVVILNGLDHSDFCPGFHVPGDVFPSDVDTPTAMKKISNIFNYFLMLHTKQIDGITERAYENVKS